MTDRNEERPMEWKQQIDSATAWAERRIDDLEGRLERCRSAGFELAQAYLAFNDHTNPPVEIRRRLYDAYVDFMRADAGNFAPPMVAAR